jgi:hypothetical protein
MQAWIERRRTYPPLGHTLHPLSMDFEKPQCRIKAPEWNALNL